MTQTQDIILIAMLTTFSAVGCFLIYLYIGLIKDIKKTGELIQERTEKILDVLKDF